MVSMDAVGLSNYAAGIGATTQAKTAVSSKTDARAGDAPVSSLSTPFADSVELSTKPADTAKTAIFDPTATGGPYEQKHIGGALATSSAKDGFNGWEAMLKDLFGIENGGDRNDMPVIYRFNPYDKSPDGRGPAAGYILANQLTNQERNFIANVYVYTHDNGLDTDLARTVGGGILNKTLAADNDAYTVRENQFTMGFHIYTLERPSYSLDNEEQAEIDAVALQTLSSNAMKDSLITAEVRDELFASRPGNTGTLERMKGVQQLIYAYSEKYSDGSTAADGISSPEAKRYISWRENMIKGWDAWDEIRTSDPESFEATGNLDAPNLKTHVTLLDPSSKDSADDLSFFAKYSERVGDVVSFLRDDQKSTLGMLYRLAEGKGSEAALVKVDQLAGAMAAMNHLMGVDSDSLLGSKDFWLEMVARNRNEMTSALQEIISKRIDAAKVGDAVKVSDAVKVGAEPTAPAKTVEPPTHLDTEA